MNTLDSLSYPVTRFTFNDPIRAENRDRGQEVRFYEQQIINLELLLSELEQQNQLGSEPTQMDEMNDSVQAHYASLRKHYTLQRERAYVLWKMELTRLYQD